MRFAALVAVIGLGVTAAAYLATEHAEEQRVYRVLELRVDWRANQIQAKIDDGWDMLVATATHVAAKTGVDAEEFRRFTNTAHNNSKPIAAIDWVPSVPAAGLSAFEATTGLSVFALDRSGNRIPAAAAPDHIPILFQTRFEGVAPALGFDLASDPYRRRAADAARDSGEPRTVLVPRPLSTSAPTYLGFWPIYDGEDVPDSVAARRARLRGFVLGVWRVIAVLSTDIEHTPAIPETIDLYVSSQSDEEPARQTGQLVARYSLGEKAFQGMMGEAPPTEAAYHFTRTFMVRDQRWRLESSFSPQAVAAERSWGPLTTLVAGLLLTLMLSTLVLRGRRQLSGAQAVVAERSAALARTRSRLDTLMEVSPTAMVTVGDQGRMEMVNAQAERMFGYARTELLGQPVEMLVPATYRGHHAALRTAFQAKPETRAMGSGQELLGLKKDGSEFPIEVGLSRIETETGTIVLAAVVDITSRRRMEAQLRQSQKMEAVGQLTGGIAHDFNNLLTVILANAEALTEELKGEHRELAELCMLAAQRGADLTSRLLSFSRRQVLTPEPVAINALVLRVIDLLHRTLGEDIEIAKNLAEDLPTATADATQLEAALLNLANNARDAMPGGGRLTIETANVTLGEAYAALNPDATVGRFAMLAISDNGTGMPPDVVAKALEPFFTTKEVGKGTGLGLSMVYGFVKQSGGHIKIYSEAGIGTTIKLYLPAQATGDSDSASMSAPGSAPVAQGGEKILLVEDDPLVRRSVSRQVRGLGYQVAEAHNGREALALLKEGVPIDLLFTDFVMPGGLNGSELAVEARKLRPGLKVLFTSGYTGMTVAGLSGLGARDRLLSKPYVVEDLARELRAALDDGGG